MMVPLEYGDLQKNTENLHHQQDKKGQWMDLSMAHSKMELTATRLQTSNNPIIIAVTELYRLCIMVIFDLFKNHLVNDFQCKFKTKQAEAIIKVESKYVCHVQM